MHNRTTPRERRRQLVCALRARGLTTYQIAAKLGIGQMTAVRDLWDAQAPAHGGPPAGVGVRKPRLPDSPTSALPRSPEKLRVLEERARRGQHLFHPLDAAGDDETTVATVLSP